MALKFKDEFLELHDSCKNGRSAIPTKRNFLLR